MRMHAFLAEADLIGRRIRLAWTFTFAEGETLAAVPAVRIRRKERDFQFVPPEPGQPDPFGVYDSTAFPPAGSTLSAVAPDEWHEETDRVVRLVETASQPVGLRVVEVLRRTTTTRFDDANRPLEQQVEVLDHGVSIGGLIPNVPYYYLAESSVLVPEPGVLRATARAGERYRLERQLYALMPGIHRQYDTRAFPLVPGTEAMPENVGAAGQLERFLALFGTALDLMRTGAEGLRDLHDVDQVDARALPLLAQWIGWDLSFDAPIPKQRHEIKYASALFRLTGGIPSAMIRTQHAVGWGSRVKEFLHNVFRSNDPPGLTLWLREHDGVAWSEPVQPLVLDTAVTGRPALTTTADGTTWLAYHTFRMNRWGIWVKARRAGEGWASSIPLTEGRPLDRYPALAARPDGSLWLFWSAYDTAHDHWSVRLRIRDAAGVWGDAETFGTPDGARRFPSATVDAAGQLWLCWMEHDGHGWALRYARFDGAWSAPVTFPPDGGDAVAMSGRPSLIAFDAPGRQLWVVWEQEVATGDPSQTRKTLVFRTKSTLAADSTGWGPVEELSVRPPTFHDADPATFVNPDGDLDLVYASDRADGWSLWHRVFDAGADAWGPEVALPSTPFTQRYPCAATIGGQTVVVYRSNQSPLYQSLDPGGIASEDFRYAGSTTLHAEHDAPLALQGHFADFSSYTYDLGGARRDDSNRYADDTVGLFLEPTTLDGDALAEGLSRVRQVAALSLPVTERAVLITEPDHHAEYIYDYVRGGQPAPHFIEESYLDVFTSALGTVVFGDAFDFSDTLV
ncbi:MAG: hypothetical protein HKN04_14280 [Rhodothermaceae bacterium]|nr:hypothetical protein [Rhodothermaceae bacterium]